MNHSRRDRFNKRMGEFLDKVDNEIQMLVDSHNNHDTGTKAWTRVRLKEGTLQATPVAGTLEFNGNKLYFTQSTEQRAVITSGSIITATTTVANTVTETTAFTATIPANELHVGQVIRARVLGFYSTHNASVTFTARWKIGGTTVITTTSVAANVTNAPIEMEFTFTVRSIGSSGTVIAYSQAEFDNTGKSAASTGTTTVNTTTSNNIILTIEWSVADPGSTLSVTQGYAKFIN